MNPLGNAFAHVLTVQIQHHIAGTFQRRQRLNHRHQLHAVIGSAQLAAKQFFLRRTGLQQCAPATRAGIAFAGAVGIDHNLIQFFSLFARWRSASCQTVSGGCLFATGTCMPVAALRPRQLGVTMRMPCTRLTATTQ